MDRDIGVKLRVGAVAYAPKIVTIWDGMREYFRETGFPIDYVLFSNYDAQVEALVNRQIQIAWNTPLAYVKTHQKTGGKCQILAMRDVDTAFKSVFIARVDAQINSLQDLKGKTVAFGSRDSSQAYILPTLFLKLNGIDPEQDIKAIRFDVDVGKHGDTGTSEMEVLRAVQLKEATAGAMGEPTWSALLAEGRVNPEKVKLLWSSQPFCHCNFTALSDIQPDLAKEWVEILLRMDFKNPKHRQIMELEGLTQWVPAKKEGYDLLFQAVSQTHNPF